MNGRRYLETQAHAERKKGRKKESIYPTCGNALRRKQRKKPLHSSCIVSIIPLLILITSLN
ncbi:uncharacterized protein DS421_18g611470 [Arachis hypogaea]|nr:uncharacterized protein DS421_18g611470 [Arachis hypogaea]